MIIVYFSKTGTTKRFITNLNQRYYKQIKGFATLEVREPVLLVTYTTGYGEIPPDVLNFCKTNKSYIQYVIATGNRNWGQMFANAGNLIVDQFDAKLLYKLELSGTKQDIENIHNILIKIRGASDEQSS